jgi:hypothetical protein
MINTSRIEVESLICGNGGKIRGARIVSGGSAVRSIAVGVGVIERIVAAMRLPDIFTGGSAALRFTSETTGVLITEVVDEVGADAAVFIEVAGFVAFGTGAVEEFAEAFAAA